MGLAYYVLLPLLILSQLVLFSAQDSNRRDRCSLFDCGGLETIGFPFFRKENPGCGGVIAMNCSTSDEPKAQFREKGKWYRVRYINYLERRFEIYDEDLHSHLGSNGCDLLKNFSEQAYLENFTEQEPPYFIAFKISETRPFFKCKHKPNFTSTFFNQFNHYNCTDYDLYYYTNKEEQLPSLPGNLSDRCSVVYLPSAGVSGYNPVVVIDNLTLHWGANFSIDWKLLQECDACVAKGGKCPTTPNQSFKCSIDMDESGKKGIHVNEFYSSLFLSSGNRLPNPLHFHT